MTSPLPTMVDLVAQPSRLAELSPEQACGLLVAIASIQPLLIARALAGPDAAADPREAARLLTVPEAAERLAIPPSFLYELIRQGRVPAQRIGPKYIRVHPAIVAEIQQRGLDSALSRSYSLRHDGNGARGAAYQAHADAGHVRRAARRPREHAGALRTGRDRDPRARRATGADPSASA